MPVHIESSVCPVEPSSWNLPALHLPEHLVSSALPVESSTWNVCAGQPSHASASEDLPVKVPNRPAAHASLHAVASDVEPVELLYRAAGHFLQPPCEFSVPSPHEPVLQYEFVALST